MKELECKYCGDNLITNFNGQLTKLQIELKQNHEKNCGKNPFMGRVKLTHHLSRKAKREYNTYDIVEMCEEIKDN